MAARTRRLTQDQNFSVQINGATFSGKADLTGQRKGGAGGRKPLGDLSNAGKLSLNQVAERKALDGSLNSGKQLNSKKLAIMKEEAVLPKGKIQESKRTTTNRKALSDISNSDKLHVGEIKHKSSRKKLIALTEEPLDLSAIAEEQCCHNHQKCIESQYDTMDLHYFLRTVGLKSDDHLAFSSEVPAFNRLKHESDMEHLVLEEIPEVGFLSTPHGSPVHSKTPAKSSCYAMGEDSDVNFTLIKTPEFFKY